MSNDNIIKWDSVENIELSENVLGKDLFREIVFHNLSWVINYLDKNIEKDEHVKKILETIISNTIAAKNFFSYWHSGLDKLYDKHNTIKCFLDNNLFSGSESQNKLLIDAINNSNNIIINISKTIKKLPEHVFSQEAFLFLYLKKNVDVDFSKKWTNLSDKYKEKILSSEQLAIFLLETYDKNGENNLRKVVNIMDQDIQNILKTEAKVTEHYLKLLKNLSNKDSGNYFMKAFLGSLSTSNKKLLITPIIKNTIPEIEPKVKVEFTKEMFNELSADMQTFIVNEPDIIIHLATMDYRFFNVLPERFKNDQLQKQYLSNISYHGKAHEVPKEFFNNVDFTIQAIKIVGSYILEYIPKELFNNLTFINRLFEEVHAEGIKSVVFDYFSVEAKVSLIKHGFNISKRDTWKQALDKIILINEVNDVDIPILNKKSKIKI